MNVPLVDLKIQHREIQAEVEHALAQVMENTSFVLGREVEVFERAYEAFSAVPHCIGVANGTDALELGLRAVGIGAGDEVILPANTFIATALSVVRAGAKPVLVDCDPTYLLIDPEQVSQKVTARTKALMPVHLFGQMAPMEPVLEIARTKGLVVIEDAAQSQGATRNGRPAGAFGAVAGTSFYPGKNLGAYGDAGAVLTTSEPLAKKVRALRNYGSEVKYHHPELGFNSRLDSLQAAVLSVKLKQLARWNAARKVAASLYDERLRGVRHVVLPRTLLGNEHVWHLYVVRVPNRDRVLQRMQADGVGVGIHYPVPIHLQGAFASLGHARGAFPVTEAAALDMLSLPLFPGITSEQQEQVAASLERALA